MSSLSFEDHEDDLDDSLLQVRSVVETFRRRMQAEISSVIPIDKTNREEELEEQLRKLTKELEQYKNSSISNSVKDDSDEVCQTSPDNDILAKSAKANEELRRELEHVKALLEASPSEKKNDSIEEELIQLKASKEEVEQNPMEARRTIEKLQSHEEEYQTMQQELTRTTQELHAVKLDGKRLELLDGEMQVVKQELSASKNELQKAQDARLAAERQIQELKVLLLAETKARRAALDELMAIRGNIRVFVRIRPTRELRLVDRQASQVLEVLDDRSLAIYPQERRFEFDGCLADGFNNEQVFDSYIANMVQHVMDGTNCTLLAYGQTGSGKTHTMLGSERDPGVVFRAIQTAFEIAQRRPDLEYMFELSILQVYNEQIQDLIGQEDGKTLEIRQQSETRGTVVRGLQRIPVKSPDEVGAFIHSALRKRAVGGHAVNEKSSRSHLVVFFHVVDKADLVLIDLAGSERLSKTEAAGERLKESQFINKSLSALGDVLQALGDKNSKHIPFRNSKLTYLLQDILSGTSKVAFFACVSPEPDYGSETFCTLSFAERIRKVQLFNSSAVHALRSPPAKQMSAVKNKG